MNTNNAAQAVNSITDALSQSAPLRAQAVQYLDGRQQADSSALAIEQSRIASRYGSNSAEAREIAARVLANTTRGNMVGLEMRRAQVAAPQSTPNGFIVYGLVINDTGAVGKGVDVTAISSAYATLASAKTDSQGAFLICVPTSAPANAGRASGGEASTKPDATDNEAATGGAAPAPLTFQLVLSSKAKSPTFRNPEVLQAMGGQIAYREIVMPTKPAASAGTPG